MAVIAAQVLPGGPAQQALMAVDAAQQAAAQAVAAQFAPAAREGEGEDRIAVQDGERTRGNDGTRGGDNTGDGDVTYGNDGTGGGDNSYVAPAAGWGGGDSAGGGTTG